jgi:hypothetical protein
MKKSLTIKEAEQAIRFANSYTRLGAIIDLVNDMRFGSWLRLLGKYWSCCDNISEHLDALSFILDGCSAERELMTVKERRLLKSLPQRVSLYRGCAEFNQWGASASLDRATAESFPYEHRYMVKEPLLVTASVDKDDPGTL